MTRISAILLGAGESKRMGVNKLSLPWGKGTLLDHCLNTLLRSNVEEVILVLNPGFKEVTPPIKGKRVKIVTNSYYQKGMSTSIRKGLRAIDPRSHGVLIALGDQPFLKTKTINVLIHAFAQERGTIIVPVYRGKQGHPVILARRFGKEMVGLKGDVGCKAIIRKNPEEVWKVRVRSEGVVKDIDLWEDYQARVKK